MPTQKRYSSNMACLLIDLQKFFFDENPALQETQLVANCSKLLDKLRAAEIPVVHIHTRYQKDRTDWPVAWKACPELVWCEGLVEGNEQTSALEEISPEPHEAVVVKKRFSGFFQTNLDQELARLRVHSVLIAGYSADVCVRYTTVDAYNRGLGITILKDCVEAFKGTTEDAIEHLKWLTNCRVQSSNEL